MRNGEDGRARAGAAAKAFAVLALTAGILAGIALAARAATGPIPPPVTVAVTVVGPGSVTGGGADCSPSSDPTKTTTVCTYRTGFDVGDPVTIHPSALSDPHTDGQFTSWGGACTGQPADTCTFTVTQHTGVSATFTDNQPPVISVSSPADNELVISPAGQTVFHFSADDPAAALTCSLDGATATSCSDGDAIAAANTTGDPTPHTLTVTGTDRWGTMGSAQRAWKLYTTQATRITSGPAEGAALNQRTAAFGFSVSKHPTGISPTISCMLANGSVTQIVSACASGHDWPDLAAGNYTFTVTSTVDFGSGQVAASSATRHFTVDLTAPQTTITGGPSDGTITNIRRTTFTFTSSEPGSTFRCSLDNKPFGACPGGVAGQATYGDVGVGKISFAVRAVDRAGNSDATPATRSWTTTADLDHDGFPIPQDCNDSNPHIHPGAREIPGNKVDENCDGIVAPFPTISSGVTVNWNVHGSTIKLVALRLTQARRDALTVTCKGKKCPFKRKQLGKANKSTFNGLKKLKKRQRTFHAGETLDVIVSAKNFNAKVVRYKLKKGKTPVGRVMCLPPGARSPRNTCS